MQRSTFEFGTLPPFLKWAGGKRWLASTIIPNIDGGFARYIEPFLGSAALFFSLRPTRAILSDVNENLIELYRVIRDNPMEIYDSLERHALLHSEEHYYNVRSFVPKDSISRAARMLYLNRTCWNGLYRVNKKGEFNVPKGTKNTVLMDTDDFLAYSSILSRTEIINCDFEESIDRSGPGDLVFADPPYTVRHNNNGFLKYNENIFRWQDQVRLKDACVRAAERGAAIIVSNADHLSIRELYSGSGIVNTVNRMSVLAGKAGARGATSETLITMSAASIGGANGDSRIDLDRATRS